MQLLSFTVRNHKSIRDEITLDLTLAEGAQASSVDWAGASRFAYPIAGIFGGNATGKTNIIDALVYVFNAIRHSGSTWHADESLHWHPFTLDGHWERSTSTYELAFTYNDSFYRYGFEISRDGFIDEWLYESNEDDWTPIFIRSNLHQNGNGAAVQTLVGTITPRELILSRSLLFEDSTLNKIARHLTNNVEHINAASSDRAEKVSDISMAIADGRIPLDQVVSLLKIADIGVTEVELTDNEHLLSNELKRAIMGVHQTFRQDAGFKDIPDHNDRQLLFKHRGSSLNAPLLSLRDESAGTIAWLILATAAVSTFQHGGILIVDEIDASLHPHLVDALLAAFADPLVNKHNGQLIFSSHDMYLLSPLSEAELSPEQIWFTDKTREGVTEIICLEDFPHEDDSDIAKQYLIGRYGAIPRLSPSLLASLVDVKNNRP